MKNKQMVKRVISAVLIGTFLLYMNTGLSAQSEDEVVRQFQRIKEGYNSGQYGSARTRIERVINIILTKKIPRSDIMGGCYLLLGAISEKEEKLLVARENYLKAKEKYSIIGVEGVDLDALTLYREVVKGESSLTPPTRGVIEKGAKEKPPRKKKFPWLLAAAGVVAAGVILYFFVLKPKKRTLNVMLGEGVDGSPTAGVYNYKKGETVNFSYRAKDGFRDFKIFLDNQEYTQGGDGSIRMDRDHTLSVTAVANEVEFITDKDALEVPEGGDAILNIQLSAQPRGNVDVTVTRISGDTDLYVNGSGTMAFTPGNWQQFQSIVIKANPDADAENSQATFRISDQYQEIEAKDITVTEIDGNTLSFVTNTDNVTVDEDKTAGFSVKLSARPSSGITANVSRSSGEPDIVVQSGNRLNFTPGNWNIPQDVTLRAEKDNDAVNDTAVIRIEAPGTAVVAKNVDVVVRDYDGLNFFVNTEELTVDEGGTASFNVKLLARPVGEIVASVTPISGDTDITVYTGSKITFTPENYGNPHQVTLIAAEDDDIINGETIIRISAAGLIPRYVKAIENDNDHLGFVLNPAEVSVAEGGTASFSVKLNARPTADIAVTVAPAGGDPDITVQSGASLVFTSETWNTEQTVTLRAASDEDDVNGETIIGVSAPGVSNGNIIAREQDNYHGNPPTVSITSPADGATVDGDITIKADPKDDFGIKRVDFYIDNELKESDINSPYQYDWSVKDVSIGDHHIKVIAYDAIDQTAEAEITVHVKDALPKVSIQAPGTTPLSGKVTIGTHAEDYKGVQSIRVYLDDELIATWDQGPKNEVSFSFVLDTAAYSNGSHILKAIARDTATQESIPAEVKIIIENF